MIVSVNRSVDDDCWFSLALVVVALLMLLLYHAQTTSMDLVPTIVHHGEGWLNKTLCM